MTKTVLILLLGTMLCCSFSNHTAHRKINHQKTRIMENKNFHTSFQVDQSPEAVFKAITNVRGWWSENITGSTENLNDEFIYQYKDVHVCKMRLIECIPGKKVTWLVLENQFNFTKDTNEWKGNKIRFEISETNGKTQLDFTQIGLVPDYECYNVCQDAWTSYIRGSLQNLITTGKGNPNTKENDLNRELIEKWGLPEVKSTADMKKENFSYSFTTSKSAEEVFGLLLDAKQWWSGLYEETIKGTSRKPGDEFTFDAGGGAHYSKQRLTELVPNKKIVWLVTESKLSFLKDTDEWTGSKICFELSGDGKNTKVVFTHEGLVSEIECYESCSHAWTGYMNNLKKKLNAGN